MTPPDHVNVADEAAFERLYDRLGRSLLRVAWTMMRNEADAEDAIQETFVNLARHRHRLALVQNVDAYVFSVLRNVVHRRMKFVAMEKRQMETVARRSVQDHAVRETDESLEMVLAALPAEQQEVIALKVDGDLTFAQIGEVLNVSPNTAASRYRYALEKLRSALERQR